MGAARRGRTAGIGGIRARWGVAAGVSPRSRRRPLSIALRAIALTAVTSLFFGATALACPIPQGTHYVGEYHSEEYGYPIAEGTFDSVSKEFTEVGANEFNFDALEEYAGVYAGDGPANGLHIKAMGTVTGGRLSCVNGEGDQEFTEQQTDEVEGYPPFSLTWKTAGHYTDTTIYGTSEDNYGEKSTYVGHFDPLAASQGIEPGKTEVIAPVGMFASEFTIAPATGAQVPPGTVAPAGALSFSVSGVPADGSIHVTLVLPPGSEPMAVYKPVGGGVYEEYPASKTLLLGNLIVLELTDNEAPWDENPEPGVISDPVVPVQLVAGGARPAVATLSPNKGTAGKETPVTINGSGFTGATVVRFGSKEAKSLDVKSPTSISVMSPPGATGKVPVTVDTPGGVSAPNKKDLFTFKKPKKVKH
jgi:IPT/TIG domain